MLGTWLLAAAMGAPAVSLDSLFRDAYDLKGLCEFPDPPYETRQASSYDRASVAPGSDSWFANNDAGNFIREEQKSGHKEFVMADLKGPGVVVRVWSPNPTDVIRFYVDGGEKPAIEEKTAELLVGHVAPFLRPVGDFTAYGWNLYFPIPYQKSLKVTVDDSDGKGAPRLYYHVEYRTYPAGTAMPTYSKAAAAKVLENTTIEPSTTVTTDETTLDLAAGESKSVTLPAGSHLVRQVTVRPPDEPYPVEWTDPRAVHNVLRSVRVTAEFDGEACVDAPLGDLMGCTAGFRTFESLPQQTYGDRLVMRFPMPYAKSGKVTFRNDGPVAVKLGFGSEVIAYTWSSRSMHFKAQWLCYRGGTRPMRDLEYLATTGKGVYVGCNASITNPVPDWWGEGDEKFFLDGETFPSTFGTGTEDFFGYGWGSQVLFNHPYHYQSRCDGPGTKGQTTLARFHILDRYPFQKSFRFDMELWHWADCQVQYGRTAYWYAVPGAPGPKSDSGASYLLPYIESVPHIKGALEGESFDIVEKTGGVTEVQDMDEMSNGKQLWWRDGKVGDTLTLTVPVKEAGRYKVSGQFCFAKDYGIHKIKIGSIEKVIDFYADLSWKVVDLGSTDLKPGDTIKIECLGANASAILRYMFGLDYLLLTKE